MHELGVTFHIMDQATMKSYPVTEENMLQRNLDTVKYR